MSSAPNPAPQTSLWDQLAKAALLGSERAPAATQKHPDDKLAGLLAQVKVKGENREAALLSAVALVACYERAGIVAESAGESTLTPCAPDDLPRCGPGAAAYLKRILEGEFLSLLPEFVVAMRAARMRVPEELLPTVLETVRSSPALAGVQSELAAVIGQRGAWLAGLNPEWGSIGAAITPEEWEVGTRVGRVALLRQLRRTNPEQAITLIESTWNSDAPEDRAAFVTELEQGLSLKDEPFLEKALDDRRKEVRQKAAELLMRLPESALVGRMWQRVAPLVRLEKSSGLKLKKLLGKSTVEIDLPETFEDSWQRDGVEPKPPQGTGEKAWWLQQMVRAVPPSRWEEHLQLSPEKCVAAFQASEFSSVLLLAVGEAARRHKDARWAKPLVTFAIQQPSFIPGTPGERLLEAVAVLDEADRDTLVSSALDRRGGLAEFASAMALLRLCPGPWSVALGRSLLNLLRHMTKQMAESGQPAWSGIGDLMAIASRMPLSLANEAQEGWPEDTAGKTFFTPVQRIIHILQFRSKMHKEINR